MAILAEMNIGISGDPMVFPEVHETQVARDLSPDHPLRLKIDNRLALMKSIEENPSKYGFSRYTNDRSGSEYALQANGLQASLTHASTIGDGVVLDIGAGTTRGMVDLYEFSIAAQIPLWFEGTVLDRKQTEAEARKPFGPERIHETSVEYLDGIPDESVSMVLGINSIMYSVAPELAARRINEVLVPGGIIKATYVPATAEPIGRSPEFTAELEKLGYDVHTAWSNFDGEGYEGDDVVLAIKPGGDGAISAKELRWRDEELLIPQLNIFGKIRKNR